MLYSMYITSIGGDINGSSVYSIIGFTLTVIANILYFYICTLLDT